MPGLHFVPWHRGSGCLGAAAPVTGAAADEYNLNVVDCNASVTVARRSSISQWGSGAGGKRKMVSGLLGILKKKRISLEKKSNLKWSELILALT
jgi:hypothetical protein